MQTVSSIAAGNQKKMPGFGGCLRFLFWVVSLFLVLGALFFFVCS